MEGTKLLKDFLRDDPALINNFVVPKYQRDYVWKKYQIEQLINDIDENDNGHFIGTVILYTDKKDNKLVHEIIDGQQRITTLSLLLSCLYKKLEDMIKSCDLNAIGDLYKQTILIQEGIKSIILCEGNNPRLTLSIINDNNKKYQYNLYQKELLSTQVERPSQYGNTAFAHSVKDIENAIDNILFEYKDNNELKIKRIISYTNKVLSVRVAPISTDNYSNAYKFFECLNNRGVPLSAIEIIKNIVFDKYTKQNGNNSIDNIDTIWQKNIIEKLGDANNQTRFLRQFYNAFKYDNNIKQESISKATVSNIAKIYEQLVKKDVNVIIAEFQEKAEIYSKLLQENDMPGELEKDLIRLKRANFVPAYTFLLYLFTKEPQNIELQQKTISFLIKYAFRRNLTDYPRTRNLDQIFIDLISECEKNGVTYERIYNFLTDEKYFSSFDKMLDALSGNIYLDNTDLTRFLLCEIQDSMEKVTKEHIPVDVWKKDDNNKYVFEIEHILIKDGDLTKKDSKTNKSWADIIANGDIEEAERIRNKYAHRIGNLTLSAYNQKLGTMSFETKRDRTNDKGAPIGYNNGLAINEDLKDAKIWNEDKIIDRSRTLIKKALNLYKMDDESIPKDEKLFCINES